jgi:hypothetical protein
MGYSFGYGLEDAAAALQNPPIGSMCVENVGNMEGEMRLFGSVPLGNGAKVVASVAPKWNAKRPLAFLMFLFLIGMLTASLEEAKYRPSSDFAPAYDDARP